MLALCLLLQATPAADRLAEALERVEEQYYDPPRVEPRRMLEAGLSALARAEPTLRVRLEPEGRLTLQVAGRRRSLSVKHVVDLSEVAAVLSAAVDLAASAAPGEGRREAELGAAGTRGSAPGEQRAALEDAALSAALAALDPRARLLPEVAADEPELGGLGLELRVDGPAPAVVAVLPGTPAEQAGLLAGDHLLAVGEVALARADLSEGPATLRSEWAVLELLRGPVGSPVSVLVERAGWLAPRRYQLTRGAQRPRPLSARLLERELLLLEVESLDERSPEALRQALLRFARRRPLAGVILDLRQCGLGDPAAARAAADLFVGQGELGALAARGARTTYTARASREDETELPLVVLVDRDTRRAAEVLAGALQGLDRAAVFGEPTRGDAALLSTWTLDRGGALRLPAAELLLSGGRRFDQSGLEPDVVVEPERALALATRALERQPSPRRQGLAAAARTLALAAPR